jgi:ATP-dependent DNA helicase RecQ
MMKPNQLLKQYWDHDSFRSGQEQIIQSVLDKKDTLALLPTGGGKSICFQIPALMMDGICIVVSPLIALMKDQVQNLNSKNIKAIAIFSGMTHSEIDIALDNCIYGGVKFLYLSPERLQNEMFKQRLHKMNVNLIAVDEAHCISEWGYDFRPNYLKISELKEICNAPIIALTATATKKVIEDIQIKLKFNASNVVSNSFFRKELSYIVIETEDISTKILQILKKVKGSSIVYCKTRKETKTTSNFLNQHGVSSHFYHGGLDIKERDKIQKEWTQNHVRVMVATNAFGMGIDKPNVRSVIHQFIPQTIESYFQEAGRAGRDGKTAYSILLANNALEKELLTQIETKYPNKDEIRFVYQSLANYFGLAIGPISSIKEHEFNIIEFCNKFNLEYLKAFNSLKILEKEELIKLSDTFSNPSKIYIKVSHNELYQFQIAHPSFDKIIKTLLRSYPGIFETFVIIQEDILAKRLNTDSQNVTKLLIKLLELKLIDYVKQNSKPKIYFLENRIDAKKLYFSKQNLIENKKRDLEKADKIISYYKNKDLCRSSFLLDYFNEKDVEKCGVCDICLKQGKSELSEKEFQLIRAEVENMLKLQAASIDEIILKVMDFEEEKVIKVIEFLLENGKLEIDKYNQFIWID